MPPTPDGVLDWVAERVARRGWDAELEAVVVQLLVTGAGAEALRLVKPALEEAQARNDGGHSAWEAYAAGRWALLAGDPRRALESHARGLVLGDRDMAERSRSRLAPLSSLEGCRWSDLLLAVATGAAVPTLGPVHGPVVMVAGGTSAAAIAMTETWRPLVRAAFSRFTGTVISGGTEQGVSGLAGDAAARSEGRIRAIGYSPAQLGDGATLDADRYAEIRRTDGSTFSPLEPLQAWADVVASGIEPGEVRLLALGGGRIARCELRVALALGATVGVVRDTGGEADVLLADPQWNDLPNLVAVPPDGGEMAAFVTGR